MTKQPLRVAVVGHGIGGAAAAAALLQRGLDVRLYEQTPALTEVGAGVAIQPNGARALRASGSATSSSGLARQSGSRCLSA